jgi:hypothetical protein
MAVKCWALVTTVFWKKYIYIAFSALSARCFFVKLKIPVLVKIIPR